MPVTPEVLEYELDYLKTHKQLQESILRDISRRIVKNKSIVSETADYQTEILQQSGMLYADIISEISKSTEKMQSEIAIAYEDVGTKVFDYDDDLIIDAGYKPEKVKNISPAMKKIIQATLAKTTTEAINLTKTTAITANSLYISACDLAHMQVASGAFTYQEAIKNAVQYAARQGVSVLYPTGYKSSLDVAVRRSVLTGVNQTTGTLQNMRADELSCDIMELTAHAGAREEHAKWQGKLVSRSGKKGYLSLSDIGYGTVTGFMGANCRHNWFMFFEGSKRRYTDEELEQLKNATVTYNGKEIKESEARAYQRSAERKIRQSKQELVMFDEARKNVTDAAEKALWDEEFEKASVKLKGQEAKLRDFCKQTGLKRDRYREQVFAIPTENDIKNWGKSVSQKAVWSNKRELTKKLNDDIIKEIKSIGVAGEINLSPKSIDLSGFSFDYKHIVERNHGVDYETALWYMNSAKISLTRWNGQYVNYYSDDGAVFIDAKNNNIRTAFAKQDFTEKIKKMMEVLKKYGR